MSREMYQNLVAKDHVVVKTIENQDIEQEPHDGRKTSGRNGRIEKLKCQEEDRKREYCQCYI